MSLGQRAARHDSHMLIQFCGDIALAANVSTALASKVLDIETIGL